MSLSVQMRRPKIIISDDAGIITRGLELLGIVLRLPKTPQDFGAVGDGVADDTAALLLAMAHPGPIDWGDKVYRHTGLTVTTSRINWTGRGARLLYDGPAGAQSAVRINLGSAAFVQIQGSMLTNANNKAYTGIWFEQDGLLPAVIEAEKLSASNCYRSGTDHTGGGGIRIVGRLARVTLTNPSGRELRLAAGAGVVGVDGVAGVNIRAAVHADGRNPANITVFNPDIRGVYSDDPAVIADLDGIIVWCDRDATTDPVEASYTQTGGYFENCWGRALKVQTERADITGMKIRRYTGSTTPPTNPDIDLQVGGGNVRGVDAIYDGFTPFSVVGFATPTDLAKASPQGMASGIQVNVLGGATLPFVCSNGPRDFTAQVLRYSDISVRGALTAVFRFNAGNSGTGFYLFAKNVDAAPLTALIQSGTAAGSGRAVLENCVNTGSVVPLYNRASSSFEPVISAQGCFGWTEHSHSTNLNQNFARIGTIVSENDLFSGGHDVVSRVLANDETWILPKRSVATNYASMMMISLSLSRNGQALVAGDNTACAILAQAATEFVAGGTTEPGTGNWRVWTGADGPRITNRSGASRTVTVWQLG